MGVTPMALAGFGNLRALSRRNDEPQAASRPFDRDRDGFVLAEGGTVFQPAVTERLLQSARTVRVEADLPAERLTQREVEVVRLMSGGYSNKEIAHALGTAEGTIQVATARTGLKAYPLTLAEEREHVEALEA